MQSIAEAVMEQIQKEFTCASKRADRTLKRCEELTLKSEEKAQKSEVAMTKTKARPRASKPPEPPMPPATPESLGETDGEVA